MRLDIPLPAAVQVVNTTNYKGNPRAVLLVDGEQVLYADGHVPDEELYASFFRAALGRMFVRYLREHEPHQLEMADGRRWDDTTDREIDAERYETVRLVREGEDG